MPRDRSRERPPIAVVGMSAVFPGGEGVEKFWLNVVAGRDLISDVPPGHWRVEDYYDADPATPDRTYSRRGAFIDPVDFDAFGFGIPPNTLPTTDVAQLVALHAARAALEDAEAFQPLDRKRTSVILGVAGVTQLAVHMAARAQHPFWAAGMRAAGVPEERIDEICRHIADQFLPWKETTFPGLLPNVVAGRIANRLDLGGTNCIVDAACASSLGALSMALGELYVGSADAVLTGGVDLLNDVLMYLCFSKTGAMSLTDDCRPFSDAADGTLMGEGTGLFVLRRLEDAERDGNQIYALIRGCGTSSDGKGLSVYAPDSKGQAAAISRAYEAAGFGPESVGLLEAHGTATKAGDAAEFAGLAHVYDRAVDAPARPWCALGSIKSQLGHTKSAAGAAGLLKAILALRHQTLPPSIKAPAPNPKLDWEGSAFYLNSSVRPWFHSLDAPRRAAVSSFGFGGSNYHVALEEYRGPGRVAERFRTSAAELFTVTACSEALAHERLEALVERARSTRSLSVIAHRAQREIDPADPIRVALVASDAETLSALVAKAEHELQRLGSGSEREHHEKGLSIAVGAAADPVAFLFPGQGSQYSRMGASLALAWEAARSTWELGDAIWEGDGALTDLVFPKIAHDAARRRENDVRLRATENAQPALATASLAVLRLLRACGARADAVAGHSFGELVALHAAGVFDERQLIRLARTRGALMARAASGTDGAMTAAVGAASEIEARVSDLDVTIANRNGPAQIVLSGTVSAITTAEERLVAGGIQCVRLPVGTAFHCPIVAPAAGAFTEALKAAGVSAPRLPVVACSTGEPYPADRDGIVALLGAQLIRPVLFTRQIDTLYALGIRTFVEVGPQTVLSGLAAACLGDRPHRIVATDARGEDSVESLWRALGRLWTTRHVESFDALWAGFRTRDTERGPNKISHRLTGALPHRPPAPDPNRAPPAPSPMPSAEPASPPAIEARRPSVSAPLASSPSELQIPRAAALPPDATALALQQSFNQTLLEAHRAYLATLAALAGRPTSSTEPQDSAWTGWPTTLAEPEGARAAESVAPPESFPAAVPPPVATRPFGVAATSAVARAAAPATASATRLAGHAAQSATDTDVPAVLRQVVAEVTGYPLDVLELDMELEAGLGIDSIKRVELLAAMKKRLPALPDLDPSRLTSLTTLRAVADALSALLGTTAPSSAAVEAPPVLREPAGVVPPSGERSLGELVLDVVARTTGYPRDVLDLDMELEAGLGIDSIKRVEILAQLRKQAPELREPDPARLGAIRTLRDVVGAVSRVESDAGPANGEHPTTIGDAARPTASVRRARLGLRPIDAAGRSIHPELASLRIAVSGPEAPAQATISELRRHGVTAEWRPTPLSLEGFAGLIVLDALGVESAEQAISTGTDVMTRIRAAAPALKAQHGFLLTVQDRGGFGVRDDGASPWSGALAGLTRTVAAEWPTVRAKVLDCATRERSVEAIGREIADEILAGGTDIDVYRDGVGRRHTVDDVEAAVDVAELAFERGDTVVVSGGARGITARCLVELCRAVPLRVVLLGRTAMVDEPDATRDLNGEAHIVAALLGDGRHGANLGAARARARGILAGREIAATLQALNATGSEATYVCADVADAASVAAAFAEIRRAGRPIRGVVHAAGIRHDKLIEDKTADDARRVMSIKMLGAQNLLAQVRDDELRCLVFFSSVAGRYGNAGQCDYAMANEALVQLAASEAKRRAGRCRVRALIWGPWDGGMVTTELKRAFHQRGIQLIEAGAGAAIFVEELRNDGSPAVVVAAGGARPLSMIPAAE